eukprot:5548270-Prymnesium_polylepis.1
MAKGCDAAQVRSGECGRHAVNLQSAVQRFWRGLQNAKTGIVCALTFVRGDPTGPALRLCAQTRRNVTSSCNGLLVSTVAVARIHTKRCEFVRA